MDRFVLEIDCWMYDGLEEYLLLLPGVCEVTISSSINFFVDVKYDSNIINRKVLKLEILFFLGILKIPSIVFFDKCSTLKTSKHYMKIEDICCKHCFSGMIEDLFEIEGIEKVMSNFDEYNLKENIIIEIDYNSEIITESEIKKLEFPGIYKK